jgi:imidazolonepropionase-like amidohydrolase/Tol biopolymer transport system component
MFAHFLTDARLFTTGSVLAIGFALLQAVPASAQQTQRTAQCRVDSAKGVGWDVRNPPGPRFEIEVDVTEGTWMSLDVSPDGEEIVFDLLGDLYVIPFEGGDARPLTSGFAWDMQPRFSPDGRFIAFTSDRTCGDNIWVMERDGSEPVQVSKEGFRLLNSPAWTPDGDFIAARKHFTSTRSLGAGEIWLYHRVGGKGLRMTERPNQQKDLGEPAFSPDGRYLFYSRDATPGDRFEYSKDSNAGIYQIFRLDRETGRTESFLGGPGGAIRPTPSPDGRYMAYVRRVRFQSVLFLHDMRSGDEWPIYEDLERDMQETWAIHGVYPSIAWTPDSRTIVFWAKGKIRRLDVETGTAAVIPFRVRTTLPALEALRFPVEVAPADFRPKMLRWITVSPAGDRVVYQALGHLYVRDVPDGAARRLTGQSDHFEQFPSFSRDGQSIVYTTWSDTELGSVRVVPSAGGEGRVLTTEPGHYLEPTFSPDGQTVVYRKDNGGALFSPTWTRETGIYAVPSAGGAEPVLVTRDGRRPHFGADSERVYLGRWTGTDVERKALLASIELDGSDERTEVKTSRAQEFHVSPDGKWLAWRERFHAFVAPFVHTGSPLELGPKTKTIPIRRVTKEAGEYLHWSSDSRRLHWSLGPVLFSLELTNAFAFLEGAPEELPDRPTEGTDISFAVAADVPDGTVGLVGGRVITMRGDEVIADGVVVVDRNRIVAVGARSDVEIPSDALVIDVTGQTVMPGLIDPHWHGSMGSDDILPQESWVNHASLAFGVTTIHDPSNDTGEIFAASELARAGLITAPRIYSTGTILYGAAGTYKAEVDSLPDALFHLRRMKAVGAFTVKSYNQPRRDQRQQIVEAARQLEMMVVPEGGSLFQANMSMVMDGNTGIEHALPVASIYDDVEQYWGATRVGYTPTLVVAYGGIWGENYWYRHTDVWANERLLTFVPRRIVDARARRPLHAPEEEWNHVQVAATAARLDRAGVIVNVGAHGQREGLAVHWEMWMFEQGGMTPLEALRTATLNPARYLGLDGDLGSLEPGKLADIIVIDGNPLEDLHVSEKVTYTMVNGRIYDAATMNQVGNHPRERGPFWWEMGRASDARP